MYILGVNMYILDNSYILGANIYLLSILGANVICQFLGPNMYILGANMSIS